jgi:hypothetical protein
VQEFRGILEVIGVIFVFGVTAISLGKVKAEAATLRAIK